MKILIKVLLVSLTLSLTTLYAGDGHNHNEHSQCNHDTLEKGISNTKVKEIATKEVKRLALEKKIAKSWKSTSVSKLGKTHYGDSNDWVVVFNNPKIKKKTKQNLYIFVNVRGKITGANYTGN